MKSIFENILILSDLDGTFFGEKASLVEKNLTAIRRFQSLGGTFTFATGRDIKVLESIFPEAASIANAPAVLCCGAYLYDFQTKSVRFEEAMDQEEFLKISSVILERFPDAGLRVGTYEGYLCPNVTDYMVSFFPKCPEIIIPADLNKRKDVAWHKGVFVAKPERRIEMWNFVQTLSLKNLTTTTSSTSLVEFYSSRAGKDRQLLNLKKEMPEKTVICVGDQNNDLAMLENCDIPACPSNAIEEVQKACAVHLCDHKDGCIADLIEKLPAILSTKGTI